MISKIYKHLWQQADKKYNKWKFKHVNLIWWEREEEKKSVLEFPSPDKWFFLSFKSCEQKNK